MMANIKGPSRTAEHVVYDYINGTLYAYEYIYCVLYFGPLRFALKTLLIFL